MTNSHGNIRREFRGLKGAVLELPLSQVELLAQKPEVDGFLLIVNWHRWMRSAI